MAALFRCLLVAVLALAAAPAAALAAEVDRDAESGVITIRDPTNSEDHLSVTTRGGSHVINSQSADLTEFSDQCTGGAGVSEVVCVFGTSIAVRLEGDDDSFVDVGLGVPLAVDLGPGDDRFSTSGVVAPVSVAGDQGTDSITGGTGGDVLAGGDGNDTLSGLGGVDDFFGETGDDIIEARDGNAERISCGAGADEARNDFTDILAECERGVDADGDGFSTAVDCNDAARGAFPGAPEIFENGADEDCDGRDNANVDRDGDGFARPVDCDDGNRRVRPGVPEIRGNRVDENCDRFAEPFAELATVVSNRWALGRSFTQLRALVVRNAPRGARVVLRCTGPGCPFEKPRRFRVRRALRPVVLHRGLREARLRPGARLKVTITARQSIGRIYRYTVRQGELPGSRIVCRAPRAKKGRAC